MENYLFELTMDEEIEAELRKNTNYFIMQDKYDQLGNLLKDCKKINKTIVNPKRIKYLGNMYNLAEYGIPRITSMEDSLDAIEEDDIEGYIEKHNEWEKHEIRNIINDFKIKMATVGKICIECQNVIYSLFDKIYSTDKIYLTQKDILDLCEMYQLLDIPEQVSRTIDSKCPNINFSELSNDVLPRYLTLEWQQEIKQQCEELRINILNFIGARIPYDFLYTYNQTLDIKDFFLQTISTNNSDISYIEECIKTFDKNQYIEYLKERPIDYLEYLEEFGEYTEYLEYKIKLNQADIKDI